MSGTGTVLASVLTLPFTICAYLGLRVSSFEFRGASFVDKMPRPAHMQGGQVLRRDQAVQNALGLSCAVSGSGNIGGIENGVVGGDTNPKP